jgi:hypothetical protein
VGSVFMVYADAAETAYEARIPAKARGRDLWPEELKQIEYFIVAKDDFFAVVDRLMPELNQEARKLLAEQSSAENALPSHGEASLEYYLVHCISDEDDDVPERELLNILEQQKSRDHEAEKVHAALINSKKAENKAALVAAIGDAVVRDAASSVIANKLFLKFIIFSPFSQMIGLPYPAFLSRCDIGHHRRQLPVR